ncbi:DNA-binding transcriptional regulator, AcrR family [Amycolatopsis sacchari]|uniref:DNA-binding transcriptional regulator, AcrR family n=2 Tax=Amycolatopsis sacchari TaxID=115433 RepID=A0A1I3M7C9_9PSEU|nr:DNA-binding transcriptional regulator, AcrR family [Amycolatopsis sacchari]
MRMGLREQKKQATRRHISDVASMLFLRRGFDNVTVAEVAEAAGVSKMTVFNYFPRKEDLFLDRHADRLRDLEQVIRARPEGESPVAALRRYQHELLAQRHPLSATVPGVVHFARVVEASPALRGRVLEQSREIAETLNTLLAEEFAPLDAELMANLLAAALETIYRHATNRMLAGADPDEVYRDQPAVVDRAFDLVERGLGAVG